jgi:hypothetical protein
MELQSFAPREIRFRGVRSRGGWSLKFFSVVYGGTAFDVKGFEPPVDMALDCLPSPDHEQGRPGLGFLIAHQGRGDSYLILAWWSNENELPIRAWVRREGEDWRPAIEGESVCVWDLEVVWEERQAWIATMMSGPARPDDYLAHVPTRFQEAGA